MSTSPSGARFARKLPVSVGWGIALAFATAVISGFAIFINSYAVKEVSDPALFTTLKNGVAAVVLLGLAAAAVRPREVRRLSRRSWLGVTMVGLIGGSVPFLLFFTGLSLASAPSAAFIHKTLFVWVALLAVPFLGERLGGLQIAALGGLLAAMLLITPPTGVTWGVGETMIAAATLFWAVEVVVARRLLGSVPSPVLGVGRLGIGLIVLVGYLAFTGKLAMVAELTAVQWAWALGTGVILAGYVGTWLAALRRAPATVVTSVLVVGAPITAVLDLLARGAVPAPTAMAGYGLILIAAALIAVAVRRRAPQPAPVPA
jgi:drug/metabolite transporter (DMT)-like permease